MLQHWGLEIPETRAEANRSITQEKAARANEAEQRQALRIEGDEDPCAPENDDAF